MGERKIHDRNLKVKAVQLALEKNIFKAAKELDVAPSNLYRWYKEFQKFGEESFCGKGSSRDSEQKKFSLLKRTLKKKLNDAELQIEIYREASSHIAAGKPMIFHFIEDNLDRYPLWKMCGALSIRTGTYHKWKSQVKSPRQQQSLLLEQEITAIFYEYKERYGNVRISAELMARGIKLCPAQVSFYMKKLGLTSRLGIRYNTYGSPFIPYNPCVFPNLLNRQFQVTGASLVWVSGITSIETTNGHLFLTIIMDLFDRKIIGWSLSERLTIKETSLPAWEMAVQNRKVQEGLLFHSDRGPQYANKIFTRKLDAYKCIRRSMSRKGNHLDNAIPRNFFTSLKSQLADLNRPLTKKIMRKKITDYIESKNKCCPVTN